MLNMNPFEIYDHMHDEFKDVDVDDDGYISKYTIMHMHIYICMIMSTILAIAIAIYIYSYSHIN